MNVKYTMLALMALMAVPKGIAGLNDEKKRELVELLNIGVDKEALKDILSDFISLSEPDQDEKALLETLILI